MKVVKILMVLLILSIPSGTYASHSGYYKVDRDDLDDDIVKEFPLPVLFGVDYEEINPDYGDSRGGGSRTHEGEDILASLGTPIVSPTEAIVIKTGTGPSSGKYVYTANPGGETFRYMHLDYIANLDPGDELDAGDFIGTVGDTGNAPDGVYHLHFETRDEDNNPQDPYQRIDEEGFTLKEKISFLRVIFSDIRNDDEYAEFLVSTFKDDFHEALKHNYNLPSVIEEVLEDEGAVSKHKATENLTKLIASLPGALNVEISNGDQGPTVILLQLYLIYAGDGPARDALKAVGPTGYFGSITQNALIEYQKEHILIETKGIYEAKTRAGMMKKDGLRLNLS